MTDKHEKIWQQIEEQRSNYESIIAKADETIRAANALKRDAREGLDSLPVAKVRRPRKGGDDVSNEAVPAQDIFARNAKEDDGREWINEEVIKS